jgi:peptide chain release factor 1
VFVFRVLVSTTIDNFQSIANIAKAASSESVPPALLTRARAITSEHKQLTEKLSDGFDTRTAKKLGEYSPIVNALGDWDKANEVSIHGQRWQEMG